MLAREAAWLGARLGALPTTELGTVLSLGSGSADFRSRRQPWIEREIFGPLVRRGVPVLHHEFAAAPGGDIVGDLTDSRFMASLRQYQPTTVLLLNVLEHVENPAQVVADIVGFLPEAGYLLVSVPHRFPYHPDPLDTMLRPTAPELATLIGDLAVVEVAEVTTESYLMYAWTVPDKLAAVKRALRRDTPTASPSPVVTAPAPVVPIADRLTMALRSTSVTCGLFRKGS